MTNFSRFAAQGTRTASMPCESVRSVQHANGEHAMRVPECEPARDTVVSQGPWGKRLPHGVRVVCHQALAVLQQRKKLCTSSRASRKGDICSPKQLPSQPKGSPSGRLVDGSKNGACQAAAQPRPKRRVEVDLLLLTCGQGLGNGHGCMQGKHGDDVDVLGPGVIFQR